MRLRRRLVLAASLGFLTALPATRLAAQGTPAAAGAWSFTDDHGTDIALPARPERIVAHLNSAATLWDYGIHPVGIFGELVREDGAASPLLGNIDLDGMTILGDTYGPIDLEALAVLKPDLIVSTTYSPGVTNDVWGLDPEVAEKAALIAPIAAISTFETPVTASLQRFEDLASALGADLEAPEVIAARQRFARASEAVRAAAAGNPELTVLVMSAWPESIYVANPSAASDLMYFQELGVNLVSPEHPDSYWEELSWEQALKYPADLILLDERDGGFTRENVADAPVTFAAHPAVKAGQIGDWYTEFVLSYDAMATILEQLAATLAAARPLG